jgi:hypothetical protein
MQFIKCKTEGDFPKKDGTYFIKVGEQKNKQTFYFAVNAIDYDYWLMIGLEWLDEETGFNPN